MFMMADEQLVEAWYRRIFYQYLPSYAEKLPVHQSFVGVRRKYRRRRNWKQKIPKAGTGKYIRLVGGCVLETASGDFHGAQHRCCSGSTATTLGRGRWHAPGDLQFRGRVFLKSPTGAEWYRTMNISEICDFQQ